MKKIFKFSQVRKFKEILNRLGRDCVSYYPNEDCQKSVFVNRVFKNFHPYWAIEIDENTGIYHTNHNDIWSNSVEEYKLPIIQYIFISNISYHLGHGEEIDVIYFMAGTNKIQKLKLNYKDWLNLKGKKISEEKYNKIVSIFKVK